MKIELHEITIREIKEGYIDSADLGVVAYKGQLNVRPAFQREFIYKDKQRNEVIKTVRKGFPLNVMYWAKVGSEYELIDGQQRTISICQYVNNDYSIDYQFFHNLLPEEQDQILDYPLMIYICEGTDKEKLEWFKIINIAGEELTDQELRNAIYTGPWLTEAKKYFSKNSCPAYQIAKDYLSGTAIRQNYLETALKWIANKNNQEIEDYMAIHQNDPNAAELWLYFNEVITWVKTYFPNYRNIMKGLDWGIYYNQYKDQKLDPAALEQKIADLLLDDDVSNKKGIYHYLLSYQEKYLNIRAFSANMKQGAYQKQNGICAICGKHFDISEMEADHITPWHLGGKTDMNNCQMLCKSCNRQKSGK